MNKFQKLWCLATLAATSTFFLAGLHDFSVSANNTAQTLPFSQDWSNTGLITVNDDWSAVPGIVGYLGDIAATSTTGVDPRTLLSDYSTVSAVDVIANQTNPDTLTNGGVAEFAITNPTIALNGSGTADAPHIIVYLNTVGRSGINFSCNIRDIDGSVDDAVQQVDFQYRVGTTGDFVSIPGGYIADATAAGTATTVTARNLALPANANNQPNVQIRIMTTNAAGNDEWVGIDDISVTATTTVAADAPVDFNGDGKTDFAVVKLVGVNNQLTWFYNLNGSGGTVAYDWGLVDDMVVPEDYDGDGKDDIAVWRPAAGTDSAFYILQSQTGTVRFEKFGLQGDDPKVIGDYDGDGKADLAVYRQGPSIGSQSTWYYKASSNNPSGNITFVQWGVTGDKRAPGDYDGDGKNDFVIFRSAPPSESSVYWKLLANGSVSTEGFGAFSTDSCVPGDYDGDGKTDLAVVRGFGGFTNYRWYYRPSGGGADQAVDFGRGSLTGSDYPVQGDYDGDGKTDIAVWRQGPGEFWYLNSSNSTVQTFVLGAGVFAPVANYNTHFQSF